MSLVSKADEFCRGDGFVEMSGLLLWRVCILEQPCRSDRYSWGLKKYFWPIQGFAKWSNNHKILYQLINFWIPSRDKEIKFKNSSWKIWLKIDRSLSQKILGFVFLQYFWWRWTGQKSIQFQNGSHCASK